MPFFHKCQRLCMKTIAFIPARCGSKSIPFKNIKPFCGQPLINWSLQALNNTVGIIDEIVVATDCEEIQSVVKEMAIPNKTKVFLRSAENAQDHSSTESVMLEYIEQEKLQDDDIFILVQSTNPFVCSKDFEKALQQYYNDRADSLLSCARVKIFLWKNNGISLNYDYKNRPRRQDFCGDLMENGAFYINQVGNIRAFKNRLSGKISVYEMPEYTALDIDEEDDWLVGEMLMKKYLLSGNTEKHMA